MRRDRFMWIRLMTAPANRRRVLLCGGLLLGLIGVALVAQPPVSNAGHGAGSSPQLGSGKRSRPEFVPGQVLVRYRNEVTAIRKPTNAMLSAQGRQVPMKMERFEGSDLLPGLRLAHVA